MKEKDQPKVRLAKATAREAIGKLIGDDAEIDAGRKEQAAAERAATEKPEQE